MSGDENKITQMLSRFFERAAGSVDRAACPSAETLATFLHGEMTAQSRKLLESHLARCAFCAGELAAAFKAGETIGAAVDVPRQLVNRAQALVGRTEAVIDLAARLLRDSIELISTTARLVLQPAPVLRSDGKSGNESMLHVEQDVGRFRVGLVLELAEPGMCRVLANVSEESGQPADGIRLTLTSADREQASFLTRAGSVVFDRIAPGDYSIAVSEAGNSLGRVRLNLMLEK